jgi:L-ascorbate metabolism protein UlaG (beta-lactamase superfamily)
MGVEDAVKAVEFLAPKKAIPMHYKTFDVIDKDPNAFVTQVQNLGIAAQVMNYGTTIEF